MRIRPFREEDAKRWDEFCLAQDLAWFWHTSLRMRHALGCSFAIKSENRSFWIEDGGRMAALVPLTVDDHLEPGGGALRRMSYGGGMVPAPVVDAPLGSPRARKLLKLVFAEIDRIAEESGARVLRMRLALSPARAAQVPCHNFLLKHGFLDVSLSTQILPLERSEEELFSGLESNHQRAVKKAQGLLEVVLHDEQSLSPEAFAAFQRFYFKAAGKVTRPPGTFELLYGYLRSGLAVLGEARYQGRSVGYAATIRYKDAAYYLMGAGDAEFDLCPAAHLIHWEIIRYLRRKKTRFYELGIQQYGPALHDAPSPKELNISRFKRGFGGLAVPAFMAEKYYDAGHFREVMEKRLSRCAAGLARPEVDAA